MNQSISEILLWGLSIILALAPAIIWIQIWRKRAPGKKRRALTKVFLLGFLSIIPIVIFNKISSDCSSITIFGYVLQWPCLPSEWNPLVLAKKASNPAIQAGLSYAWLAALEEIGKLSIVKYADVDGKRVNTINDALIFSIVAALSFAFVENIVYFYSALQHVNNDLFQASNAASIFIFRSIFTATAHLIFSGIAGYFYGLGKFAKPLASRSYWKKESLFFPRVLNNFLHVSPSTALKIQLIVKGLFIATVAHATFNFLLQQNELLWVIILVLMGAFYIVHLLQRKSGALFLRITDARPSTMAPRDEDVVLELVGMWIQEGKYEEVMEICERLLERDPDNNVVKLFLAEAHHKKELQRAYKSIKALFTPEDIQFRQGFFKKARRRYEKKINKNKNN